MHKSQSPDFARYYIKAIEEFQTESKYKCSAEVCFELAKIYEGQNSSFSANYYLQAAEFYRLSKLDKGLAESNAKAAEQMVLSRMDTVSINHAIKLLENSGLAFSNHPLTKGFSKNCFLKSILLCVLNGNIDRAKETLWKYLSVDFKNYDQKRFISEFIKLVRENCLDNWTVQIVNNIKHFYL